MCCMGVAMICVGVWTNLLNSLKFFSELSELSNSYNPQSGYPESAESAIQKFTVGDSVSTYLIVGGIFVIILYLLPFLFATNFKESGGIDVFSIFFFPLLLVYLGILIWGTIIVINASGNIIKLKSCFKNFGLAT